MYDQITPLTPPNASTPAVPAATPPAPTTTSTPAAPTAPPVAGQRRSVGPGFVLSAVLASALLASGGTYVAVSAAKGTAPAPTGTPAPDPAAYTQQSPRPATTAAR